MRFAGWKNISAMTFGIAVLSAAFGGVAQAENGVFPPAPQSANANDGKDGPGFVRVIPHGSGVISIHGVCRFVVNKTDKEMVIDISTPEAWKSYWAGASDPNFELTACKQ